MLLLPKATFHQLRLLFWGLHIFLLIVAVYLIPVDWDEGWTFCSARHLIQDGHYGCKYNGNFTPTRLTTSLSTVLMAAAGFGLFGVSYVAGRALFAIQALLLVFFCARLARKASGEVAELACLGYLLFVSGDQMVHPMTLGARALGEVPALLAFILGISMLQPWLLPKLSMANPLRLALSLPFLLLACCTKVQFRPFVAAACVGAGLLLLIGRSTRLLGVLILAAGVVTWFLAPYAPMISMPLKVPLDTTGMADTSGLIWKHVTLVLDPAIRVGVLKWVLVCYAWMVVLLILSPLLKDAEGRRVWESRFPSLLPLLIFSLVALLWFMTLARDWARYAAPGILCFACPAAIVIKALFAKLNQQLPRELLLPYALSRRSCIYLVVAGSLFAVFNSIELTKGMIADRSRNRQLEETAVFLNSQIRPGEKIETYDAALFHLLEAPYVYPPDDYHLLPREQRAVAREQWSPHSARFLVLGYWSRLFDIAPETPEGYHERARFGDFVILEKSSQSKEHDVHLRGFG